jgi:hypothetical protein
MLATLGRGAVRLNRARRTVGCGKPRGGVAAGPVAFPAGRSHNEGMRAIIATLAALGGGVILAACVVSVAAGDGSEVYWLIIGPRPSRRATAGSGSRSAEFSRPTSARRAAPLDPATFQRAADTTAPARTP